VGVELLESLVQMKWAEELKLEAMSALALQVPMKAVEQPAV